MSDYELTEKIGQGGMGIVYRAVQHPLERVVALKILPSSLMSHPEALPRFLREVKACTALNHPNIIKILDCGELKGQPFYAMEFLEARTIRQMLTESGPPQIPTVVDIFAQILEALGYCHREGLVHRDIKPHNIMVDRHQHATLMDFGLVKVLDASGITRERMILGTPNYVPPEMLQGEEVGPTADLFSLAAVAYEMLVGEKAFPGKNIRDIAPRILTGEPAPIEKARSDCPDGLARILSRCLKKVPSDRYQSAEEVVSELVRLEVGAVLRGSTAFEAPPPAPAGRVRAIRKEPSLQAGAGTRGDDPTLRGRPASSTDLDQTRSGVRDDRSGSTPERGRVANAAPPRAWSPGWIGLVLLSWTLVVATAFVVWRVRPVFSPSPVADPMGEISLETGPDWAEIRWSSTEPYRGSATVQTVDRPPVSIGREERESTGRHRIRFEQLDVGRSYRCLLSRDQTILGPARSFKTMTRSELVDRLLTALVHASIPSLTAQIETEAVTSSLGRASKAASRLLASRERLSKTLGSRLTSNEITGGLETFARLRRDYFGDGAARPDQKRRLWMALESLEDLRLHCLHLHLEFPLPFRLEEFQTAGFGPDPLPLGPADGVAGIAFQADANRPLAPGFRRADVPPTFHAAGTTFDAKELERGNFRAAKARTSYAPTEPFGFPDKIEKIHATLQVSNLAPQNRFALSLGPSLDRLEEAAIFRSRTRERTEIVVALDPRWIQPKTYVKLDFGLAPAIMTASDDWATLASLAFRWQTRRP